LFKLLLFLLRYAYATIIPISARLQIQLRGGSCPDEPARKRGWGKIIFINVLHLLSGTD
jgi:hypothetical protein